MNEKITQDTNSKYSKIYHSVRRVFMTVSHRVTSIFKLHTNNTREVKWPSSKLPQTSHKQLSIAMTNEATSKVSLPQIHLQSSLNSKFVIALVMLVEVLWHLLEEVVHKIEGWQPQWGQTIVVPSILIYLLSTFHLNCKQSITTSWCKIVTIPARVRSSNLTFFSIPAIKMPWKIWYYSPLKVLKPIRVGLFHLF